MADEALKEFYVQGLQALQTAGQKGRDAASEISAAATSPELKQLLQQGTEQAQRQADQVGELLQKAGAQPSGQKNAIIEGIQAGAKQIRDAAKTDAVRDAGIIDSSQIALHYFIAAFGSLAAHAKALGMNDEAATLKRMVEEDKQMDQRYTDLAERSVNPRSSAS